MCRLFASLSADGIDLRSHLVASRTSLLAQSTARRTRIQRDGWGVGHYAKGRPVRVVRTRPVFREKRRLAAAVAAAQGPVVLAHIRAASNPLGHRKGDLLRPENQQPFVHGRWMFAHNGILYLPDLLEARLGRHRRHLRGNNDSEVYFRLLMDALDRKGSVPAAFAEVVRVVRDNWERAPAERRRKDVRPFVGLNCVLSDGERLWAFCKYDGYRARKPDRWLCPATPRRPLFEMCWRLEEDGRGVVVASERTEPRGDWERLRDGSLLEARLTGGKVRVRVRRFRG